MADQYRIRQLVIALIFALAMTPVAHAFNTAEAVLDKQWQAVHDSVMDDTAIDESVREFLFEMACLELDLDCAPSIIMTDIPEARTITEAEAWVNEQMSEHAGNPVLLYLLGALRAWAGDTESGIILCSRAIESDSLILGAYLHRGLFYTMRGDYADALTNYDAATAFFPDVSRLYTNRGVAYDEQGNFAWAIEEYNKAIRLKPEDGHNYYNRANTYRSLREDDSAAIDYSRAIERNPEFAEAVYNRGNTYADLGEFEKAISDYETFIAMASEDMGPFVETARAKKKSLEGILESPESDSPGQRMLTTGVIKFRQGDVIGALDNLNQAIKIDSTLYDAYYYRAAALEQIGDDSAAYDSWSTALRLHPNDTTAFFNRAQLLFTLKRYDEAVEDYSAALALDNKYGKAYLWRAKTYEATDQKEKAIADYEQYLANAAGEDTRTLLEITELVEFLKSDVTVDDSDEAGAAIETAMKAWEAQDWMAMAEAIAPEDLAQFKEILYPIASSMGQGGDVVHIDGKIYSLSDDHQFFMAMIHGLATSDSPVAQLFVIKFMGINEIIPRAEDKVLAKSRISVGSGAQEQEIDYECTAVRTDAGWKMNMPTVLMNMAYQMSRMGSSKG